MDMPIVPIRKMLVAVGDAHKNGKADDIRMPANGQKEPQLGGYRRIRSLQKRSSSADHADDRELCPNSDICYPCSHCHQGIV